MKDNWIPIDEKAKKLPKCLLLCYDCDLLGFQVKIGSFRMDEYIRDEELWLENDWNDFSTGYASTPIPNIIAYQPFPYIDESKWKK